MKIIISILLALSLSACSLFGSRVVQQGNAVTPQKVAALHIGMTKTEVSNTMGSPLIRHIFNDNRWDYVYTVYVNGKRKLYRRASLAFKNGHLASIDKTNL